MAERELLAALDALAAPATFWWRDDDAGRADPRLDRLLALASKHEVPVALAVVPAWLEDDVARAILACPQAVVLQHGSAHRDQGLPGAKRIELGGRADRALLLEALGEGQRRLQAAFGERFLPVLVPPWNRIDPDLVPLLPGLGFVGLSTFGEMAETGAGLIQLGTHADLVAWRDNRRPLGFAEACAALASLLRRPAGGPIGILSHHLVMDEVAFAALDRLLRLLQDHPKASLASASRLFRR